MELDRQEERDTIRQAEDRHAGRRRDREMIGWQTGRQTEANRQYEKQGDKDRQEGRERERQTDRQTDRPQVGS